MNRTKDDHSVTSSPLMSLEFIIIHTIIWGFVLCILFYFLDLLLIISVNFPVINRLLYLSPLSYLRVFFVWPGVMFTALIITIIRCILRRTTVTLSGDIITIRRLRHTNELSLMDFIRPKTVESYVHIHLIGWFFRRRYLIFRDNKGKEARYRLYEFSEKDLGQVMQLLTRINRTEHLGEEDKTEIMMNAFQNINEILIDPRHLWQHMARRLIPLSVSCLVVFGISSYLFYWMLSMPLPDTLGSVLPMIIGYGSILLCLGSFLLLCRTLQVLLLNAMQKKSCPQKIAFVGNMLQIDHTVYSINRIRQVVMNPPAKKLSWFGHYHITLVTMEGTHKYWLGSTAGLGHGTWQTICRHMQGLLISCPAKLIYH